MPEATLSSAAISASSHILREVLDPDCNLAIWTRDIPCNLANFLSGDPRDIRFQTPLSLLRQELIEKFDNAGFAGVTERDRLAADIEVLANHFCSIMGLGELELRLEVVTTNSCRKWHADYVKARLITTYIGSGTQWLDQDDANRVRQGAEPRRIGSMSAGDVGIFKGKLATDSPAIHRSPPISESGERRLLLVLNPPVED